MTTGHDGIRVVGVSFLTGLCVGGVAGLLYAPQSGARTRRRLGTLAEDARERAGEMVDEAKDTVNKMVDRSRRLMQA